MIDRKAYVEILKVQLDKWGDEIIRLKGYPK